MTVKRDRPSNRFGRAAVSVTESASRKQYNINVNSQERCSSPVRRSDGRIVGKIECDGQIYRASLADCRRYGFPVRRGHGVGEAPAAVQLTLFSGAQ